MVLQKKSDASSRNINKNHLSFLIPFTACILAIGCSSNQGTSFQTLGIPQVSPSDKQATLIIGWQNEERKGWLVKHVRIDNKTLRNWSFEKQSPTIVRLTPGKHSVQLFSIQFKNPGKKTRKALRRTRSPVIQLHAEKEATYVCRINFLGKRRLSPRLRCTTKSHHAEKKRSVSARHVLLDPLGDASPSSKSLVASPYQGSQHNDSLSSSSLLNIPYETWDQWQKTSKRKSFPNNQDQTLNDRIVNIEKRLENIEKLLLHISRKKQ